jgi:hypothetical protein
VMHVMVKNNWFWMVNIKKKMTLNQILHLSFSLLCMFGVVLRKAQNGFESLNKG